MSEKLWSLYASYELIVMGDRKLHWLSDSFDNSRAHKLFQVVAAILVLFSSLKVACLLCLLQV